MQQTKTLIVLENQIHKKFFSGNRAFQSTPRKFLMFQETETPKKSLYFRKRNFLIFQEMEHSHISGKVYSEP